MELEFKKDFREAAENWELFWKGTLGRPAILAVVPRKGFEEAPRPEWGAALYRDHDDVIDQALRWAESHEFLCEAVPFFTPSLMTGFFPAVLGAEIVVTREPWGVDSAVIPFDCGLDEMEIRLRRDSEWWDRWLSLCGRIKERCAGRMVFGEATLAGNLDALGALRGTEKLMMDFYDNPEGVHRALKKVVLAYEEILDEMGRIFEFGRYGGATRHGLFADGAIGVPQCDFGFSISKAHFDEFALPYLKREIEMLDFVEYHLDGPGSIIHVDSICSIERIGVVQWVPGAGNEKRDWSGLFEKIASLGKGLLLSAAEPGEAKRFWDKYNQSGRVVMGVRARTREEAMAYLDEFGG